MVCVVCYEVSLFSVCVVVWCGVGSGGLVGYRRRWVGHGVVSRGRGLGLGLGLGSLGGG